LVAIPDDGEVIPDLPGKLPGRGVWVHPRAACVSRLEKEPRRVGHGLRAEVRTAGLAQRIRQAVLSATLDGISMASASGALVGGHDQLRKALVIGRVEDVIVATDASPRTIASLREVAAPEVVFVQLDGVDKGSLGQRTGRGARAALGVYSVRGSTHLRRQLRRLSGLG